MPQTFSDLFGPFRTLQKKMGMAPCSRTSIPGSYKKPLLKGSDIDNYVCFSFFSCSLSRITVRL